MDPVSGLWKDVEPRPAQAVVNIGDSLHHLSKRQFKSCMHRVQPYTTGNEDARYSVIYFMRPEQSAVFADENGKTWKSFDWHTRKFNAFREASSLGFETILDGRV